jgi:hypothetical protein
MTGKKSNGHHGKDFNFDKFKRAGMHKKHAVQRGI